MNKFMSMQPSNSSFQELLGNGIRYIVPRFQRDYAWESEQWEDLWSDIDTLPERKYHYLGYLVLQQKEDDAFDVIDGQQRLVTLSLVAVAGIKKIQNLIAEGVDANKNEERVKLLRDRYLGFTHPVALTAANKLTLNRNNKGSFDHLVTNLAPANDRHETATNRQLRRAFQFFADKDFGDSGEAIAEKIESVANGMIFTKIVVQEDTDAFMVFETLNARGVQLSTPDLLKNAVFSLVEKDRRVTEKDLDALDEKWSRILGNLERLSFEDFVRDHYSLRHDVKRESRLFARIKKSLADSKQGSNYIDDLHKFSSIYAALRHPHDAWWANQDAKYQDAKEYLLALDLFNIRQPLAVLMAAFEKFSPLEFVRTAKYIYALSIRCNVLGLHRQRAVYTGIANKIMSGDYKRASHIKNGDGFRSLYPKDDNFRRAFAQHRMPIQTNQGVKKIRFVLSRIEKCLGVEVDYENVVLEHVCPKNPDGDWNEHFGQGVGDVSDRLGNMVLLNRDNLGRKPFAEKKAHYQNAPYKLAQQVAGYDNWSMAQVNNYQMWLAENAVKAFSAGGDE